MASEIKVDTISEKTSAGGVTIDGVLLKDTQLDIGDSKKLLLGAGDDLTLYHDGSNSYITNSTGALKVATETSGIAITLGHTTSEVTVADNFTVTGTITLADGSLALADLDIDGGTDIGAAVVDADLFIIDDGAGGTNRKVTASRIKTYAGGAVTAINNATANELVTIGSTTTELEAEAKLLFDGTNLTLGNATAEDIKFVFDGNAQDFYIGLDDGTDDLYIGTGSTVGSNGAVVINEDRGVTIGKSLVVSSISNIPFYNDNAGSIYTHDVSATDDNANFNTAYGINALDAITTGDNNAALGYQCGNSITTGSSCIMIGHDVDGGAAINNQIAIGDGINYDASNRFFFGKASNIVYNNFDANNAWTRDSDERLKRNIQDDTLGLDFINDLRTVTFQWKDSSTVPQELKGYSAKNQMTMDVTMHGMIAQEVKAALDTAGISTFGGWDIQDDGTQSLSREMFVIPLLKAVQELSAKNTALEARITTLEG